MNAIVAEAFRRAGIVDRLIFLLPLLAMAPIATLSFYGGVGGPEACVTAFTLQLWIAAGAVLIHIISFWAWQHRAVTAAAFDLVDRGIVSVIQPDATSSALQFVFKNRKSAPSSIRLPFALQFVVLAFLLAPLPMMSGPFAERLCAGLLPLRPVFIYLPAPVFGPVICLSFIAMTGLWPWLTLASRLRFDLWARSLRRDDVMLSS